MKPENQEGFPLQDRSGKLGMHFVSEYLHRQGHNLETVRQLPEEERKRMMAAACTYSATRLFQVEKK